MATAVITQTVKPKNAWTEVAQQLLSLTNTDILTDWSIDNCSLQLVLMML